MSIARSIAQSRRTLEVQVRKKARLDDGPAFDRVAASVNQHEIRPVFDVERRRKAERRSDLRELALIALEVHRQQVVDLKLPLKNRPATDEALAAVSAPNCMSHK